MVPEFEFDLRNFVDDDGTLVPKHVGVQTG
jgi:hypothetical protein